MIARPAPEDLLALPPHERGPVLRAAIATSHSYHYERNAAYRRTVSARGLDGGDANGSPPGPEQLTLMLRPAAITFKSYVETVGPFPQDDPAGFLHWMADQASVPLARGRIASFRPRYSSLDSLLVAIERVYADAGLEIVTSSGTSGQASIVLRDATTVRLAIKGFFTGIRVSWGVDRGTALVFVMPRDTRVAMARTAVMGTRELDWGKDSPVHFTVPFRATPDRIRLRAGRTFRPGARGRLERRVLHPLMAWGDTRRATGRYVSLTLDHLRRCREDGRPVLLLGGLSQLHHVALSAHYLPLPPGSRVATGGGVKDDHPASPTQVRADLLRTFGDAPVADVYGLAEANWAAFECSHGNYHIPPWVYPVVTDDRDRIVESPDAVGLLAFFDPVGGGGVIPPFYQTADRVRLVNGAGSHEPDLSCPCGADSSYIAGAVQRVDLMDEAGCAAQL